MLKLMRIPMIYDPTVIAYQCRPFRDTGYLVHRLAGAKFRMRAMSHFGLAGEMP